MITRNRDMKENGGFTETFTEEQSSAELNVNSKGDIQWSAKVYKDNPEEWAKTMKGFLMAIREAKQAAIDIGLARPQ